MFNSLDDLRNYETIKAAIYEPEVTEWFKNQKYHMLKLLLNEGILKYKLIDNVIINYFKSTSENSMYVEQYIHREGQPLEFFISMEVVFMESNYEVDYKKYKVKGKGWKNTLNIMSNICLAYFYYLDFFMKNRKVIIKDVNPKLSHQESDNITRAIDDNKTKNVRIVSDTKTIYELSNIQDISVIKKKLNRKTESWGVIGHYRHYKNGNIVFIKQYTKGTGRKLNKEYKI